MKVTLLRIALSVVMVTSLDFIVRSNPQSTLPSGLAFLGVLFLVVKGHIFINRMERHPQVICPQCGFGNIPERFICKRCRADLENVPITPV